MRSLIFVILIISIVGCGEPLLVIPGGQLSGQVQAAPSTWTNVADTIQVEWRSSDPYSINIWGVGIERDLYIATAEEGTTWSEFIQTDPNARVRLGSSLYELKAIPVTDSDEKDKVEAAYLAKYDLDRKENWVQTGLIFRLDRL
jgi:hypothetical protein